MEIVLLWIVFALLIGFLGNGRKIGFAGAFFFSLLLSPVIGLIITLCSKDKEDEKYKEEMLQTQQRQQESLSSLQQATVVNSVTGELERLKKLKDDGVLSDNEFDTLKKKALAGVDVTKENEFPYDIVTHLNTTIKFDGRKEKDGKWTNHNIRFADGQAGIFYENRDYIGAAIFNKENKKFVYYKTKDAAIRALYCYLTENGRIFEEDKM